MPGISRRCAQALDRRGDHAQVLGDQRQAARAPSRAASSGAAPGPRRQWPARASRAPRRDRPVGDQPAKVIEADEVEQLAARDAGARSTSGSRAGASPASRRRGLPQRCPRAVNSSGGAPAIRPVANSSGWRAMVDARARHVQRKIADQPHAALGRVARAARATRARSAPGRAPPLARPPRAPSPRSRSLALAEVRLLARARPARPGRSSSAGQQANAERDLYGERQRSGGPSGRTCQQDCPAAAASRRTRTHRRPSRPEGSEVGWSWTAARARLPRGSSSTVMRRGLDHDGNGKGAAYSAAYPQSPNCQPRAPVEHRAPAAEGASFARSIDRGPVSAARLRSLPRQALSRRQRARQRDDLPRRPRSAARLSCATAAPGAARWREAPHAPSRRAPGRRSLERRASASSARPLELAGARLERPLRQLAARSSTRKLAAGQRDIASELAEGARLLADGARPRRRAATAS